MNKAFWQMVGMRRSRSFFIVLCINAAIIAVLIMWFLPQKESAQAELTDTEQKKLELQNQIVELPKKFEQMQKNEAEYDTLHARGFFADQDRIAFRQILNDLRTSSGVRQVAYDIKPRQVVANQALGNTDKQLLNSEVVVTLKGLTDMEMRSFVNSLQQAVPGISAISKQYFRRDADLTEDNLIKLGNGEPIDFVESGYSFNWYTLNDKADPYGMQTPADPNAPPPAVPGMPVTNVPTPIPPVINPPAAPQPAPAATVPAAPVTAPASPTGGQ